MNILYDLEVLDYDFFHNQASPEEWLVFDEIRNYIRQRLNALKDKMDSEEKYNTCCVMIHILPPKDPSALPEELRKNPINIAINGYSGELTEKIQSSITQADVEIIEQRLENLLSRFGN